MSVSGQQGYRQESEDRDGSKGGALCNNSMYRYIEIVSKYYS